MVTAKKVRSNLYLNKEIKLKAQKILAQYGLTLSDAVNIFLAQVVMEGGIPFEVKIPNNKTRKILEEVREGKNLENIDLKTLTEEVKESAELNPKKT
jgi:DNA-damage-inducible protein J